VLVQGGPTSVMMPDNFEQTLQPMRNAQRGRSMVDRQESIGRDTIFMNKAGSIKYGDMRKPVSEMQAP